MDCVSLWKYLESMIKKEREKVFSSTTSWCWIKIKQWVALWTNGFLHLYHDKGRIFFHLIHLQLRQTSCNQKQVSSKDASICMSVMVILPSHSALLLGCVVLLLYWCHMPERSLRCQKELFLPDTTPLVLLASSHPFLTSWHQVCMKNLIDWFAWH